VADLKTKIDKLKGYTTDTQELIYSGKSFYFHLPSACYLRFLSSGKSLTDGQVLGTIGFSDKDFLVLLASKVKVLSLAGTAIGSNANGPSFLASIARDCAFNWHANCYRRNRKLISDGCSSFWSISQGYAITCVPRSNIFSTTRQLMKEKKSVNTT
jgi:hypothetical protein